MREILASFASALDAEISVVEKESRDGSYELLAGQREEKATGALYSFVLADSLRLPDDATGTLKVGALDTRASVVAVDGNRIWILTESTQDLPDYIPSARLLINETELLRRLKEKIEALSASGEFGLAEKAFGVERSEVGIGSLPAHIEERIDVETTRSALRQCIGSDLTFLWGPPGTGKTFSIAALVATFCDARERTLVVSHTHAAVEQALWAAVEPSGDGRRGGPLTDSPFVSEGRILKVGALKSSKIDRNVHLNSYLEDRASEREQSVATLLLEQRRIDEAIAELDALLVPWRTLSEADESHRAARSRFDEANEVHERARSAAGNSIATVKSGEQALAKAQRSFLIGRNGRVKRAESLLQLGQRDLARHQASAGQAEARLISRRDELTAAAAAAEVARAATADAGDPHAAEERFNELGNHRARLSEEIRGLREAEADDADSLLENALAIFATLTKLYTDRTKLGEMHWDNVIIDEASMAMLPLVAFAASRATRRLIICGDMYQLPPIVHSPEDSAGGVLGHDIYDYGIRRAVDGGANEPTLARLMVQRRMHPGIADVARELIAGYRDLLDDDHVRNRQVPVWLGAVGKSDPLVIVDIASLHSWSGKIPGSLSRFNFVSAQASVEVASLFAAELPKPDQDAAPKIGIVTPYSAQKRYVDRLIKTLNLQDWVTCGTVHTFQGSECDVIIFDSVLGDPHWTARLTDPHQFDEVKRDINVAVTRARHKFVFVGDAAWMKKNAKPDSGYGKLWNHVVHSATLIDGAELFGEGFRQRVGRATQDGGGWSTATPRGASLLTETTFYDAFVRDLAMAKERVILYTPFIGKTRWPLVEPHIAALRDRGVAVFLLHKPLSDRDWKQGDPAFGRAVFESMAAIGVRLIPISGVHAKTIVIDSSLVYDGSLNWASQTSSYEHMWRLASKEMARLIEKMLQLEPIVQAYSSTEKQATRCPGCGGPLLVINQTQQTFRDAYPVKLACYNHSEDKQQCSGYLRRVDGRPPFTKPPGCPRGMRMKVTYAKSGRPWAWQCAHKGCRPIRWARGDCER